LHSFFFLFGVDLIHVIKTLYFVRMTQVDCPTQKQGSFINDMFSKCYILKI